MAIAHFIKEMIAFLKSCAVLLLISDFQDIAWPNTWEFPNTVEPLVRAAKI